MILFLLSRFSSAGIGRTGTFIALDTLLKEIAVADSIDVINCVSKLRQQRAFSIQTDVSLPPFLTVLRFLNLQKIWENKLECKIYVTVTLFQALRVKDQLSTENISILQIFSSLNFCLARTENVVYQKIETAVGRFGSRLNNIFLNFWSFLEISFFYRCNMHSYRKPLFTPLLIMATLLSPSIKWMKCDEFQMKDSDEIGKRC